MLIQGVRYKVKLLKTGSMGLLCASISVDGTLSHIRHRPEE